MAAVGRQLFPPPDNLLAHDDPQAHPQHHDDHTVSINGSSSSSSNNAPNEPTIDLSSWLPRSFRLEGKSTENWIPKSKSICKKPNGVCSENNSTPLLPFLNSAAIIDLSLILQLPSPQNSLCPATEDPNQLQKSQWIALISQTFLSLSPPIVITPLIAIKTSRHEHRTFAAAQNSRMSPISHTLSPSQHTLSAPLTIATAFITPTQMIQRALLYSFKGLFGNLRIRKNKEE